MWEARRPFRQSDQARISCTVKPWRRLARHWSAWRGPTKRTQRNAATSLRISTCNSGAALSAMTAFPLCLQLFCYRAARAASTRAVCVVPRLELGRGVSPLQESITAAWGPGIWTGVLPVGTDAATRSGETRPSVVVCTDAAQCRRVRSRALDGGGSPSCA